VCCRRAVLDRQQHCINRRPFVVWLCRLLTLVPSIVRSFDRIAFCAVSQRIVIDRSAERAAAHRPRARRSPIGDHRHQLFVLCTSSFSAQFVLKSTRSLLHNSFALGRCLIRHRMNRWQQMQSMVMSPIRGAIDMLETRTQVFVRNATVTTVFGRLNAETSRRCSDCKTSCAFTRQG
jgi:hypothetical protein